MATGQPLPENVQLRYGTADVFERADTRAKVLCKVSADDALTVLSTEGEFYQVRLADGGLGYIYFLNLTGAHMPLTDSEQRTADDKAAAAAKPPGGWRGMLNRFRGA